MALTGEPVDYEGERQRIIEENRQRLHELGLDALALFRPKKPALATRKLITFNDSIKAGGIVEKRRSTRIASSPRVYYAEGRTSRQTSATSHSSLRGEASQASHSSIRGKTSQLPLSRLHSHEPSACRSTTKRKPLNRGIYRASEMKVEHALRSREGDYPFFVKGMLKSHTSGGFWLGLPSDFCASHFNKDDYVILEDEDRNQWECKYLHNKHGLSGGWRGFSLDHHLRDGDALLFELVSTRIFKVQITRAKGFSEPVSMRYALAVRQEYESVANSRRVYSEDIQRPRKQMTPMMKADSGDDVKPKSRRISKNSERYRRALVPVTSRMTLLEAVKLEIATDFPEVKSETSEVYVSPSQKRQNYSYCRLANLPKAISVGDFARPSKTRKLSSIPFSSQKHYFVLSNDSKALRLK